MSATAHGSSHPFPARRPPRCLPRQSFYVILRNPDGFIETAICGHVPVIHAHEPTVTAAAPANPPLLKEQCEPPPNGGILGISG